MSTGLVSVCSICSIFGLVNVVAYNGVLLVSCIGVALNVVQTCKEKWALFTSYFNILYILNLENIECNDPRMIPTIHFIFQSFPIISIYEETSLHIKPIHFQKHFDHFDNNASMHFYAFMHL